MRGCLERDVLRGKLEKELARMVPGLRFAEARNPAARRPKAPSAPGPEAPSP